MKVLDYLKNNLLILDGGMGTLLQANGLTAGELPERWNISHPDIIQKIHRDYYNAGSNVVSTNTFGANSLKFDADTLEAIVKAAVANAKAGDVILLAGKGHESYQLICGKKIPFSEKTIIEEALLELAEV